MFNVTQARRESLVSGGNVRLGRAASDAHVSALRGQGKARRSGWRGLFCRLGRGHGH